MRKGKYRSYWFLVFPITVLLAGASAANNWPRFRGPNGTGNAADREIPIQWSAQDGLLWKTPIPGVGNSSPVVWDQFVFLQSASADGKERRLYCLNVGDGKVLWSQGMPGTRARTHNKNTLASSTPATDGKRVYALFWDGTDQSLAAYDFTGRLVWSRNLGAFTSQHGSGASPVVYQDKVFLANDQDGSSVLLALDAATGKTAWQSKRDAYRACYSSPFILEQSGSTPQLIVASTAGITAYDPQTGDSHWHWSWHFSGMALRTVASPIFGQGVIVANCGDGSGERHTAAVKVGGKGDVTGSHLAWESTKRIFPYVPSMLASGDHFFFVNDQGLAGCVSAANGDPLWTERLGSNVSASPVLIAGNIYAVAEEGDVYVFPAADHFKLLAHSSVGEAVIATPAVADNRLFIRGRDHLFCIGKASGKATPRSSAQGQ